MGGTPIQYRNGEYRLALHPAVAGRTDHPRQHDGSPGLTLEHVRPRAVPGATIALPLTIAPNDFTHLHVHSEFSLLDGLPGVP
jgi:hypothetical protein